MSALSQKESDIQLMLAASCHLGTRNCDYQMERYVYKRRLDGIYVINLGKTWEKLHLAARVIVGIENPQVGSLQLGLVECRVLALGHWARPVLPSTGTQDPHVSYAATWAGFVASLHTSAANACPSLQCLCCPGSGSKANLLLAAGHCGAVCPPLWSEGCPQVCAVHRRQGPGRSPHTW